ncbi:hypothetical protein Acr_25g0005400 [Actinidia rufa]|uniref:Retrotransposon gag domain-containing protein n=1 Tax=Actinidia rufa TaxID=165716 RepID=A0A7J0GZD1_9ERIC|nr:hypothetical protein Acr_25g0005400 [Actinidia rufa]
MHLRSRLLPPPNASSPVDNRTHTMASNNQALDLEDQMMIVNLRAIKAMVEPEIIDADHRAYNRDEKKALLGEKEAPFRQNLSHPNELVKWEVRKLGGDDHLAVMIGPPLGTYEGKINPRDHLDSYRNLMMMQGYSDEVICKAFWVTLKGSIRTWFRKLSPKTIDSFGELSRLFIANFISCQVKQKNASHLFTVHQKREKFERLRQEIQLGRVRGGWRQ